MIKRKSLAGFALLVALGFAAKAAMAQGADPIEEDTSINISNILKWGGWCGWVIILHSVASVALIIEHFMNIKREKLVPPQLVDEIEALFEEEEYQEALELCESNPNFLTNVLAAGLPKLNAGFDTMKQVMSEQVTVEATKLHTKISYLSLIGNMAPMWGLFGTVQGMIFAFASIVELGPNVTPKHLAFGVQQALITTLEGLLVAMPAMMFYFYFRNRVVRIINELSAIGDDLVERFRPQKQ
jgi:biopolymer transport protein ExbB